MRWPLSLEEWNQINSNSVKGYGDYYWLRTPAGTYTHYVIAAKGSFKSGKGSNDSFDTRPALSLNLSKVLFTFKASGDNSKATASAGNNLTAATAADSSNPVKLTAKDPNLSLSVIAASSQAEQSGSTLSFSYSNASTGTNRYVSSILTDSAGTAQYYGRLADCSTAAEGGLSIPLAGVADGTYTLQIFSEQSNGEQPPAETTPGTGTSSSDQQASNTAVPQTSDNSRPVLWSMLMFGAGAVLVGTIVYGSKKAHNR